MLVTNIHQKFSKCHLPGRTGWGLREGSSPALSRCRTLQSWFPFLSSVFIFFMIFFYRNELYRITDACITTKRKRGKSISFNSTAHMARVKPISPAPCSTPSCFLAHPDSECPRGSVQWQTAHFLRLCCQQAHLLLYHTRTDPRSCPLVILSPVSKPSCFLSIIGTVLTNE